MRLVTRSDFDSIVSAAILRELGIVDDIFFTHPKELQDGKGKKFVVFSVGYSVLNRTSKVDVGSLMLKNGGGGHKAVGTCRIPYSDADRVLHELVKTIKGN